MAIWIVIGVPLAVFLIGVVLELNGTFAEEERQARRRWEPWTDPTIHEWTDLELATLREEKFARERRRQKTLQEQLNQSLN